MPEPSEAKDGLKTCENNTGKGFKAGMAGVRSKKRSGPTWRGCPGTAGRVAWLLVRSGQQKLEKNGKH